MYVKIGIEGDGEMAPHVKALSALARDPGLIPHTYTKQVLPTRTFNSRGSYAF